MQALVWQWNATENQNFTVTNDSSIPLRISYLADNDDKSIGNITYGFSCTWQKWQAPNIITAGRASLLTEVWETDLHGWKVVWLVLMCMVYKKTLSKSAFKHANCLLSLTRCQGIPASVLSSISWMNARYEAKAVRREMFRNEVCIIIHQDLENIETFSSRPTPRLRLLFQDQDQDHFSCPRGASRVETKTKVSRLHPWI